MKSYILLCLFLMSSEGAPYNFYPLQNYIVPPGQFFNGLPIYRQTNPQSHTNGITFLLRDDIGTAAANLITTDYSTKFLNIKGSEEIYPKLSIANIIEVIPFLPIEINVPDAIASIISKVREVVRVMRQRIPIFNNFFFGGQPARMMFVTNVALDGHEAPVPVMVFISNPIVEFQNDVRK